MKNLTKLNRMLLCIGALLIFSCSKNDDSPNGGDTQDGLEEQRPNIVELAGSVSVLSDLVEALEMADTGLTETLSANGAKTIFAPTNDAFDDFFKELDGYTSLKDFDEASEKQLLTQILKYHVVGTTKAFSSDLSDAKAFTTLQGEDIRVAINVDVFIQDKTNVDAKVVSADNEASNGVVHIIDKIMLPQTVIDTFFPKPTLIELVKETPNLSLLLEAMQKANLVETLNGEGPFTIFAPTNAAIEDLFTALGDGFNGFEDFDNVIEVELLSRILKYHVLPGNITAADLEPGNVPTLLTDNSIEIIASGNGFIIGDASEVDANITFMDNMASNGVIHGIDKILIPTEVQDFLEELGQVQEKTIKELVEENNDFSFLKEALQITGLLDVLDQDGPFTVFAPSNEALGSLLPLLGGDFNTIGDFDTEFEVDLLRDVLTYHLFSGRLTSSDLFIGEIPTLSGNNKIEIMFENGNYVLRDVTQLNASFLLTDIMAKNGVIHSIDRLLLPKSVLDDISNEANQVLLDFLARQDNLTDAFRVLSLVGSSLNNLLENEFTFFLPTNAAFLDLFDELEDFDSIADFNTAEEIELLVTLLKYHCVETGKINSGAFTDMQILPTAQGETLQINIDGSVFVQDKTEKMAKVTAPDKNILKGVIHVVDKVLLPQEIRNKLLLQ
ncbi:fasciclin domain-containing protein [Costertonia aggregata]|uniref:Fasciclin domain-containing protein n=1 Tax=Costertonia aggregata TaxID=343403 RepID=A0A7H9AUF2_9FLAO|nr:fasciclin domain-containing protein [Costertonia aggregata]QLG47099.1 fasciclin domain-containing protein [Costertonia aggregata]